MKVLDNPDFIIDIFKTDERYKTMIDIDRSSPPFFGEDSKLSSVIVGNKTIILGNVVHSVIGNHVLIGKNAEIKNSVIMDNCIIEDGVKIENAVISQNSKVSEDVIGHDEIICI